MAKTQFIDGTHLTPSFMAAAFGTNASTGHVHSGTDADGSLPKIDLTAHVSGELPVSNFNIDRTVVFSGVHHDAVTGIAAGATHVVQRCGYYLPASHKLILKSVNLYIATDAEIKLVIHDTNSYTTGVGYGGEQDIDYTLHTGSGATHYAFDVEFKNTHVSDAKDSIANAGWSVTCVIVPV